MEPLEMAGLACAEPTDQDASNLFYLKCNLIFKMMESKIDIDNMNAIFREVLTDSVTNFGYRINADSLKRAYKKVCGIRERDIFSNWINSSGCPKLTLTYEFNKRYKSLDLQLKQEPVCLNSLRIQKNMSSKIHKIFGLSGEDLERELLGSKSSHKKATQ